jgi:hypothetical protein
MMIIPKTYSLYWKNIQNDLLEGQRMAFDSLGIPLVQDLDDRTPHGVWMDKIIESAGDDEIIVFSDIDAFPLSKEAYLDAVDYAERGFIFGLAQVANHKNRKDELYAGPMFLAFAKKTWREIGRPSLRTTVDYDAGQFLTVRALEYNVGVHMIMPDACLLPKWPLANLGVFGIGTFYDNRRFFHLFESRSRRNKNLFLAVAQDVAENRPLDFNKYLQIMAHRNLFERFIEKVR